MQEESGVVFPICGLVPRTGERACTRMHLGLFWSEALRIYILVFLIQYVDLWKIPVAPLLSTRTVPIVGVLRRGA